MGVAAVILLNNTHEVRAFLTTKARTELSRRPPQPAAIRESLSDIRATSQLERQLFGVPCPCGAKEWLCIGPTGLPASAPHPERVKAAS